METIRKNGVEERDDVIGKAVYRYLPYWPMFLLLFAICVGAAYAYLRLATPLYESTAKILIKDEKKGAEDPKAFGDMDILSSKKIIENEMEVIQSNTLIGDVVKELGLYASISTQNGLKKASAYASCPIQILEEDSGGRKNVKDASFIVNPDRSAITISGVQYPLGVPVITPYGKMEFIPNRHYCGAAGNNGQFFFDLMDIKSVAASIEKRLKVTATNKLSSIISLSLLDEVPERGEDILNTLLTDYNKAIIEDKNVLAANTLNFIDDRLLRVRHELDSIEHGVQHFKSQQGAIDMDTQGKIFLQNVGLNDQKLAEVNMQLAVLEQVDRYARSKDNSGGIVPSTVGVNDPSLSQLTDKLYSAELEYESLKKTTAENNPLLMAVADRIEKIRPAILDNIESQRKSLEASRNNLTATNNSYSSMLGAMPDKERQLVDINRSQVIKNDIYTFLLQKKEATALSFASTVSDSRVIDRAESSDKPVSPKGMIIYLLSGLLALVSGVALLYCRETFNRKIMFRYEIEKLTEIPIIGEIIADTSLDPIVIGSDRKTFIAEQFRKLRISLNFIGINTTHKRILVTSSISGEGKSFIAANLALTLALTGKKVALLDFDLNNPSLNNKLNINERKGITDYLLGIAEPEDIIHPTDLHQNLFLVPTGDLPLDPSELMMNGRPEELLNYLDGVFDYMVVDTAPVSPVTDAYILSPYCDATVFVVRHGYTPKLFVQRIDENNRINKLTNMAIVFNGVVSRGFGKKHYGYGYGYGYVYNNKEDRKRFRITSDKTKIARRIVN